MAANFCSIFNQNCLCHDGSVESCCVVFLVVLTKVVEICGVAT